MAHHHGGHAAAGALAPGFGDDADYSSDFEGEATSNRKRRRVQLAEELSQVRNHGAAPRAAVSMPSRQFAAAEFDRFERQRHMGARIHGVTAYERHTQYINDYVLWYGKGAQYRPVLLGLCPPFSLSSPPPLAM